MTENDVIESKRLNPCMTEKEYNNRLESYILYCSKPENFKEMVKCEDDDGNPVEYNIIDDEIKFSLTNITPVNIYYTVKYSHILDQLKEICKC